MHYRKFDRRGQIMPKGGMTLAIAQEGNQLTIAMAQCGRKDNFSRDMGRTIAAGRLASGKGPYVRVITLPDATGVKSFVHNQDFVQEKVQKLLAGGK